MPVFEYVCSDCGTPYEILHKTAENKALVECPSCQSKAHAKKFSTFAASVSGSGAYADMPCASGSCGVPMSSPCSSGMCGLD
ncbi:MAG: zinc ribbon domain-containing protein [Ignavibacteria bacterium]|nr:zinc ribbon domain-containing protein [Ignavibacteria bacterium]